jgi:hypothetical protein
MYMDAFGPLRTVLCIYESIRLAFLIKVFSILQPEGTMSFPWLALISPGALFLLMVVFWRIDMSRYALFRPLYLAGKILSILTVVFWFFSAENDMIRQFLLNSAPLFIASGILVFLLLGDMFSALAVMIIFKENKRR